MIENCDGVLLPGSKAESTPRASFPAVFRIPPKLMPRATPWMNFCSGTPTDAQAGPWHLLRAAEPERIPRGIAGPAHSGFLRKKLCARRLITRPGKMCASRIRSKSTNLLSLGGNRRQLMVKVQMVRHTGAGCYSGQLLSPSMPQIRSVLACAIVARCTEDGIIEASKAPLPIISCWPCSGILSVCRRRRALAGDLPRFMAAAGKHRKELGGGTNS